MNKDKEKDTMAVMYVGGAPKIKMGKYIFIKDTPRDVPIAVGKNLLGRKISPFKEFKGTFTKTADVKAIEDNETDAEKRKRNNC